MEASGQIGRHAAHGDHMHRALALARRGLGRTAPNPMVGAVVVRGGRIVGEGYHHRAGQPHAEVLALRQAGPRARGATLYVTLEPCNHDGRTPPCCDAILASGIARVVAADRDPNPVTDGRGFARLRRSRVRLVTGVLAREARDLNAPFHKAMRAGLPWVVAKIGQSVDGKIATRTGQSRWITSAAARRLGHQWRSRVDAVLVGVNTVLQDDPRLSARAGRPPAGRPMKIIVDSRLRTPVTARCLSRQSPAPTLIATTVRPSARQRDAFARRGAELLTLPARRGRVPLRRLCRVLVKRGLQSLLIEGGGEVLAGALAERLVDRVVWCIAPLIIGGRGAPSAVGGEGIPALARAVRLADMRVSRLGPDLVVDARVMYPGSR